MPPALYDTDFFAWTREQAARLRHGPRNDLDWVHLAEEIEDLGREQRNACISLIEQILRHFLKISCVGGADVDHWDSEIAVFRDTLERRLTPAIRHQIEPDVPAMYHRARRAVAKRYKSHSFPDTCPYSFAEVLDIDFLPPEAPRD